MGHFTVSVQVYHNGEQINVTDRVYSERDWAAEHPNVLTENITSALGHILRDHREDSTRVQLVEGCNGDYHRGHPLTEEDRVEIARRIRALESEDLRPQRDVIGET